MRFVNDHDPLPLLAHLQERYGERLLIDYRQRQPGAVVIDFVMASAGETRHEDEGCGCCGSCG